MTKLREVAYIFSVSGAVALGACMVADEARMGTAKENRVSVQKMMDQFFEAHMAANQ